MMQITSSGNHVISLLGDSSDNICSILIWYPKDLNTGRIHTSVVVTKHLFNKLSDCHFFGSIYTPLVARLQHHRIYTYIYIYIYIYIMYSSA